ncbi:hypothetical protein D3C72_2595310 [compost metagenome]
MKECEKLPAVRSGKSASDRHCSENFERPEATVIVAPSGVVASSTSAPSGSLRTIS